MKKVLIVVIPILILILLLPFVNGYLAEREIRNFFRRSLVGEEAITSYERGYFTSNCRIEFNAGDLMRKNLSENELGQMAGLLTQLVLRSEFDIYHCPSLKDRTFFCKGEGKTTFQAPGDITKDIDLKATLGWDACVRASFRIPGGKIDPEIAEIFFPGSALYSAVDCEVADITGQIKIPLAGKETSLECHALGMNMGEGGFSNFVLRGGSRLLAENVRAYAFTGELDRAEGGDFRSENGRLILHGNISNDLHNIALFIHSDTRIEEEDLPMDLRLDLANCNFKKLNELRTGIMRMSQKRKTGLDLSIISQIADVLDVGKDFLDAKPSLGCSGMVGLPEGTAALKFHCDTSRVKLNSWKDILRLMENLDGGLELVVPKAALNEGGTLEDLEYIWQGTAVESNGYYVMQLKIQDLLTK